MKKKTKNIYDYILAHFERKRTYFDSDVAHANKRFPINEKDFDSLLIEAGLVSHKQQIIEWVNDFIKSSFAPIERDFAVLFVSPLPDSRLEEWGDARRSIRKALKKVDSKPIKAYLESISE